MEIEQRPGPSPDLREGMPVRGYSSTEARLMARVEPEHLHVPTLPEHKRADYVDRLRNPQRENGHITGLPNDHIIASSHESRPKFGEDEIEEQNRAWAKNVATWLRNAPDDITNAVQEVFGIAYPLKGANFPPNQFTEEKISDQLVGQLEDMRQKFFDTEDSIAGDLDVDALVYSLVYHENDEHRPVAFSPEQVAGDLDRLGLFMRIFGGEQTVQEIRERALAQAKLEAIHLQDEFGREEELRKVEEVLYPQAPHVKEVVSPAFEPATLPDLGSATVEPAPVASGGNSTEPFGPPPPLSGEATAAAVVSKQPGEGVEGDKTSRADNGLGGRNRLGLDPKVEVPATPPQLPTPMEMATGVVSPITQEAMDAITKAHREKDPNAKEWQPGWTIKYLDKDGVEHTLDMPQRVLLENPGFGIVIAYGLRDGKYDGPVIAERNGGGAFILVTVTDKAGKLYVGAVETSRDAVGNGKYTILEGPRGFSNVHESHEETADRELGEEMNLPMGQRIQKMGGVLVNPNTTYFVTDPTPEKRGDGEDRPALGIAFFQLELRPDEVEFTDGVGTIKQDVLARNKELAPDNRGALEKIKGSTLIPVDELINTTPDMMTKAAVAQWAVDNGALLTQEQQRMMVEEQTRAYREIITQTEGIIAQTLAGQLEGLNLEERQQFFRDAPGLFAQLQALAERLGEQTLSVAGQADSPSVFSQSDPFTQGAWQTPGAFGLDGVVGRITSRPPEGPFTISGAAAAKQEGHIQ